MTTDESLAKRFSSRGIGAMIFGCLLGLASGLTLAWDGVACARVLEVLLARTAIDVTEPGSRLVRVSWSPIGVAVGTALTLLGLQQAKRGAAKSTASNVFVLLSAIFAGIGALMIANGIQQAQAVLTVLMTLDAGMTTETIEAAVHVAFIPASRGWMLVAIAQIMLAAAAVGQAMTHSNNSSPLHTRPMEDLAAIVLVGLFGVMVSWSWFFNGLALERINGQTVKASDIVALLHNVLSYTMWGAWALLASTVVMAISSSMGYWKAQASNR